MEILSRDKKDKLKDVISGLLHGYCAGHFLGQKVETCEQDNCIGRFFITITAILESKHNFIDIPLEEEDFNNYARKIVNHYGEATSDGVTETINHIKTNDLILNNLVAGTNRDIYELRPFSVAKETWQNSNYAASNGCLMPILSILYFGSTNPKEIYPDFYRELKQLCRMTHYDVRCVISQWCLCYFIQQIIYASMTEDNDLLINLKKNCFRIIKMLCKTVPKEKHESDIMEEFFLVCNTKIGTSGYDKKHTYQSLTYIFWVVDLISKYVGQTEKKGNLGFKEIISAVEKYEHDNSPIIGAILGAFLGFEKLQEQISENWVYLTPALIDVRNQLFKKMGIE
jgi:ADP-ribosylglycohydrolase